MRRTRRGGGFRNLHIDTITEVGASALPKPALEQRFQLRSVIRHSTRPDAVQRVFDVCAPRWASYVRYG